MLIVLWDFDISSYLDFGRNELLDSGSESRAASTLDCGCIESYACNYSEALQLGSLSIPLFVGLFFFGVCLSCMPSVAKWEDNNDLDKRIVGRWMLQTSHSLIYWAYWNRGSLGGLSRVMCQGTFGCPIRAAGYATSVIPSSLWLTVDTIVDIVGEFSVPSVLQTGFLCHLVWQGLSGKSGRRLGFVISVSSNGSRA